MATKLYPTVQFKPGTYELDEFDCASIFLLVGTEKAMLIDTGIGIGDLLGAVRQLTDKPLVVVMSHGHGDHTGGCGQFEEIYLNEKDWSFAELENMEMRKGYAALIAKRQGGLYAYDPEKDILPWEKAPRRLPLKDGQKFDLGGGRVVTAYDCPGHTAGEMVFLDESTRTLFAGDAVNCNLGLRGVPGDPNFVSVKRPWAIWSGCTTCATATTASTTDTTISGRWAARWQRTCCPTPSTCAASWWTAAIRP